MNKVLSLTLSVVLAAMFVVLTSDEATAQTKGRAAGNSALNQYGPFDEDGDGIPNGRDPDFVKPRDGSGHQFGKMNGGARNMHGKGNGYGPGNGSGNQGIGPRNGMGYGPGSGTCDGTGPKGRGGRGR